MYDIEGVGEGVCMYVCVMISLWLNGDREMERIDNY